MRKTLDINHFRISKCFPIALHKYNIRLASIDYRKRIIVYMLHIHIQEDFSFFFRPIEMEKWNLSFRLNETNFSQFHRFIFAEFGQKNE